MADKPTAPIAWLGRDRAAADRILTGVDFVFIDLDDDVSRILDEGSHSAIVVHFEDATQDDLTLAVRLMSARADWPLVGLIEEGSPNMDAPIALGLDDYLFPPLIENELQRRIAAAYGRRRRYVENFEAKQWLTNLEATYSLPPRWQLIAPAADLLSGLIQGRLRADGADLFNIKLALSEVLANAMEHGSLGVTFDEKIEALEQGTFNDLLEKRLADPELAGRMVEVKVRLDADKVEYTVSDQGSGFDVEALMKRIQKADPDLPCGRGLFLIEHYMDEYRYEDGGRRVILTKYL